MKQFDVPKLMRAIVISWVIVLSLGFWFGWAMNNRANTDREVTKAKLANTQLVLNDTLAKLADSRADRDFYRSQYENGRAPSQIVRVVYRGSLKETANNPGPDDAWQEIELTRDYPQDGVIYVKDLWEVADYAKHDAKINQQVLAYVVDQFGSTEESGPGR